MLHSCLVRKDNNILDSLFSFSKHELTLNNIFDFDFVIRDCFYKFKV